MNSRIQDELERRKLPNLPSFKCTQGNRSFDGEEKGTQNTFKSQLSLRSLSEISTITEEIINIIKSTDVEGDITEKQVEMTSVKRKDYSQIEHPTTNHNIASVAQSSSQRIAGMIDLFQDEDGFWIRKIQITKVQGQGLGFFIKKGNGYDRKNGIFISRVSLGSILDINGLLHSGDEVLEVNRVNLRGFPLKDVALMMQIPDKLLLTTKSPIPVNTNTMHQGKVMHKGTVRRLDANFNREDIQATESSIRQSQISSINPITYEWSNRSHQQRNLQENQVGQKGFAPQMLETGRQQDKPTTPRVLPEVPKQIKSPRKLPTPPENIADASVDEKNEKVGESTAVDDVLSTSPSGFKRAEVYRVQTPPTQRTTKLPIAMQETAIVTDDDGENVSSSVNLKQSTKFKDTIPAAIEQGFKRAFAVSDASKTGANILGFFKSHSARDAKKEQKNEATTTTTEQIFEPYKSDNLNSEMDFTKAFSGMLAVNIVNIEDMQTKSPKEKKCYCTIEIDDEFKASTTKKKLDASNNIIQIDEQFDIEISHASEFTLYIFTIGSSKQHSLASSGVIFLERLLTKATSHCLALQLENTGIIYISLDFTEAVKYLKRAPSNRKSGVFGFNIASTLDEERNTIPIIVRKCVEEIECRGMHIVGLYRISGNARKKKLLKAEFDQDSSAVDVSAESGVDCNVLTGILKDYLRELPEPLIPQEVFNKINKARDSNPRPDLKVRQKLFSELLRLLHYGSRATLIYIMDHLARVEEKKETNKMDISNLAVCFGPVLLCPASTNAVLDFKKIIEALEFLLNIWPKKHEWGVEIEITNM
eukprot:gene7966-8824_t